jgi:hypothetical protein
MKVQFKKYANFPEQIRNRFVFKKYFLAQIYYIKYFITLYSCKIYYYFNYNLCYLRFSCNVIESFYLNSGNISFGYISILEQNYFDIRIL